MYLQNRIIKISTNFNSGGVLVIFMIKSNQARIKGKNYMAIGKNEKDKM